MTLSTFIQLSKRILVRDIYSEFGLAFDASCPVTEVEYALDSDAAGFLDEISPVKKGDEVVGWIGVDCDVFLENRADAETPVSEEMEPIDPGAVISCDSSVLTALRLFGTRKKHFYVVLDGADLVGTLHYVDFLKPAGRACFFSLTMDLEEAALRLCLRNPVQSFNALSAQPEESDWDHRSGADAPPGFRSDIACPQRCRCVWFRCRPRAARP